MTTEQPHPIDRTHPADCRLCDYRLSVVPEWVRRAMSRTLPAKELTA